MITYKGNFFKRKNSTKITFITIFLFLFSYIYTERDNTRERKHIWRQILYKKYYI